ncbi:MAG TPA: iron-containing alcohol dehydrogenase [Rectinemataceae bacterium]|nr:iron-containing alcohol dehydrogenase [Rectinemataceae bacterium]
MFDFDYYNPTRIVFGRNRLNELDALVPASATVLITSGGGSAKRSGLIDKVRSALGSRKVFEFEGIEPNPHFETAMRAVEVVKRERIDFLLAVGGGSVIDGTKFIALASRCTGDAAELLNYGLMPIPPEKVSTAVPLGVVLTLPATGSEMNSGAVISFGHSKLPVMSGLVFPKFSLLDPSLTFTLPKRQVANGVVDAFVHTTEQYLTFPAGGLLQDRIAEGILQTLIEIGQRSVDEPENYDIRANHVWCATMALNGIIGAGVPQDWATHMIGHELTALFGIDHGQSLAIVLPSLLGVQRKQKRAKLLQYAERVWGIDGVGEEEKITLAIERTRDFFERLGVKTKLSDYGIGAERIPEVVEQLKSHGMIALSETGDITPDVSRKILVNAL